MSAILRLGRSSSRFLSRTRSSWAHAVSAISGPGRLDSFRTALRGIAGRNPSAEGVGGIGELSVQPSAADAAVSSLEQKIKKLEIEIEEYMTLFQQATDKEDKKLYWELLKEDKKLLGKLYDEKKLLLEKQSTPGGDHQAFETFFRECVDAHNKKPTEEVQAEYDRYSKIGCSLIKENAVISLVERIREDKKLIGGNGSACPGKQEVATIGIVRKPILYNEFPPFYFVEGHSGVGKTQLPFAIEACNVPTVHLVLAKTHVRGTQLVYRAFKEKSDCFQSALAKDLDIMQGSDLSVDALSSCANKKLFTAVFILHELKVHGFDVKGVAPTPKSLGEFIKKQVQDERADGLPVFVLDEALTSGITSEHDRALQQFRLARNIFCAVGLVVILMGTNSKAKAAIFPTHNNISRSEGGMRVWCRLITQLPRMTQQSLDLLGPNILCSLPEKHASLKQFLESQFLVSTPWFVQLVLKALEEIVEDRGAADMDSGELMDLIFSRVAASIRLNKANSNFLFGQYAMHLAWHKHHSDKKEQDQEVSSFAVDENCFISHHFGKPWHEDADLYLRGRDPNFIDMELVSTSKNDDIEIPLYYPKTAISNNEAKFQKYNFRCYFAGAESESLMYLALGGGNKTLDFQPAFLNNDKRVSTEQARKLLDNWGKRHGNTLMDGNPSAKSRSGDKLESLAAVAMEVASHEHGVSGGPVESFLGLVAAELLQEYPSSWTWRHGAGPREYLSSDLCGATVPYLSSANDRWPDTIHHIPGCEFGNLIRTKNKSQIDFAIETIPTTGTDNVGGRNITGEAKNHEGRLSSEDMRRLLDRVPSSSRLHIVFTAKMQERYFNKKKGETWEEVMSQRKNMENVTVLKVGVGVVRGEGRNAVEFMLQPMHRRGESNQRLVVFYPVEDLYSFLKKSVSIKSQTA